MSNKIIAQNNIKYSIDLKKRTAQIIRCNSESFEIHVPYSIKYESNEYIITSILGYAFQNAPAKSIQFAPNSNIKIIEVGAFSNSSIESITIPSQTTQIDDFVFIDCLQLKQIQLTNNSKLKKIGSYAFTNTQIESITITSQLIELKKEWCQGLSKLNKVKVSPENLRYRCIDDKMIIGKSSMEKENYDCLIFCVRNIKTVKIPDFIERICPYAFENCKQLQRIEFSKNSKLEIIDDHSFSKSSLENITIPSSVTKIGMFAFFNCDKFQQIEISEKSKLQMIDTHAFGNSFIESITIPSDVENIKNGAFSICKKLQIIEIGENSKLNCITNSLFSNCHNCILMIPVHLNKIIPKKNI